MFVPCPLIRSYVVNHQLHKFNIPLTDAARQELEVEYDHVVMLSAGWLYRQKDNDQRKFLQQFLMSRIANPAFEYYTSQMASLLSQLPRFQVQKKVYSGDTMSNNELVDLLYTEKAQDLLAKLNQDLPDMPLTIKEGVARMWAAGVIPKDQDPKKPLTGSEKRKLKKYSTIDAKTMPKPVKTPDENIVGNVEINEKPAKLDPVPKWQLDESTEGTPVQA